jgi:heptosyltransferase-2
VKILIRLPNWLGDVIMATPALRAMRQSFPHAEITAWSKPAGLSILDGAPWFDHTVRVGEHGGPLREGLWLRKQGFDQALLLPTSWSSAISAFLSGARQRVGYGEDGRGILLTQSPRVKKLGRLRPIPKVDFYLRLAERLGADRSSGLQLELPVSEAALARADAWLRKNDLDPSARNIAFNVGASFGPSKLWPAERWAAVADHFLGAGHRVIVYGGPKDEPAVRAVLGATTRPGAVQATDVALTDLAAHMRRAALLIATDAGGRHVGVAAGTNTVVIMGPNHPGYSESYDDHYVVLLSRPSCWPCHLRVCPIDHRCMRDVEVAEVVRASEAFLGGGHPYQGRRPWVTPAGREHVHFSGAASA